MKNNIISRSYKSILWVGLVFMGLFSACEDPLTEEVFSFISTSNFYKTAGDAEAAVLAIYASQTPDDYYSRTFYDLVTLADDQVRIDRNPTFLAVDNWQLTPEHPFPGNLWTAMYRTINRANTVIERVPAIEMDATKKSNLIAEAYFLRGSNYFNLVRLWGGVPISTSEVNTVAKTANPKAPVEKVYEQIILDLQAAEKSLPVTRPSNEAGRVTKGAAQALLAEVYLTQQNWKAAADKAQEVISSGQYQLLEDFGSIFSIGNKNNKEIIYSIQYDGIKVSNWYASFSHNLGTDNPFCANGTSNWAVDPTSDLWKTWIWSAWDKKDLRRTASVYDTLVNKAGKVISVYNLGRPFPAYRKWNAPGETSNSSCPVNPVVLRYADVLLIFAEATSQANNGPNAAAYDAINRVRRRAYKQPQGVASEFDLPAGLSAPAFREAVLKERSLEFTIENKRMFDLLRTNQIPGILIAIGKPANPNAKLFPIPKGELDANTALTSADQNPGY